MHIAKKKYAVLLLIRNAAPFLKIKQFTLLKYSNRNWIYRIFNKVPVRNQLRRKITFKVKGLDQKVKCHISVNNQCIFTKFAAVIDYVIIYYIPKCQLICIIYAWISHNSIVMKMSTENCILRKQVTVNDIIIFFNNLFLTLYLITPHL